MILDMEEARKAREKKKLQPSVVEKISVDVGNESDVIVSEVIHRWHLYHLQKNLNVLFSKDLKLPLLDYQENISEIVNVERILGIRLAVLPADFTANSEELNRDGRSALFKFGTQLISTPLLPTEEQARMFAILLHQKISHSNQT